MIYVITVTLPGAPPTRVVVGCSIAHDFAAWVAANGGTATMVLRDIRNLPLRDEQELQRSMEILSDYAHTL